MVALMVAAATAAPGAHPAAAHFCAAPVAVEPGEVATVTVGVAAEGLEVTEVVVRVPDGFVLRAVPGAPGWRSERLPGRVRFTGGTIHPFGCGYFAVAGIAEEKGVLVMPVTVTDRTGAVTDYDDPDSTDEYSAQIVYAGVDPPGPGGDEGEGLGPAQLAVIGAVGLGVLGVSGAMLRSALGSTPGRRRGPDRRPGPRPGRRRARRR